MKKYEAYKNSGIEWIGEIPTGWNVIPMKHYFYMKGRIGWQGLKADEFIEEGPYLVTGTDFDNGKVCWERCYHISEERFNEAPEIHVQQGDLLITKDGTVGKLALIDEKPEKVSLNSHLLILRPVKGEIDNHFVYWALQSMIFKDYTGLASSGSTMASLSQEKIGEFPLLLPTATEQQSIASYLDYKVGQIDASVSAINTQINELKAYRQSIISEAVTKGLNPNVPMKDSGIEWIGEIPEGWEVIILKRVAKVLTGTTPSTTEDKYWDNPNYTWYTPSDIKEDSVVLDDSERKVSSLAIEDGAIKEFPAGSLLVVGIGSIGKVGITNRPCSANQQLNALVFHSLVNPQYGAYFVFASRDNIRSKANAALLAIINQTTMGNVEFLLPPIDEQNLIANYLDDKTAKIDSAIISLEVQRDNLNALKRSIISEAVTGKIDVRGWKPCVEQ